MKNPVARPVLVIVVAVLVLALLGGSGPCSGPGVFGYVYRPEQNVSVCYDAEGTPQWQVEGFAEGALFPTALSAFFTTLNSVRAQ